MNAQVVWNLENTYTSLPQQFYSRTRPTPVKEPQLVLLNEPLARELGLNPETLRGDQGARIFSGNELPPGSDPIAQAYAGHQFGHFTMLGDGRAVLLGEQVDPASRRWDVQLKGSGQTPYSRRGDGRAALAPMLREYLISEAMAALGIPTTRSLAVVTTGEPVFRETVLPGAVLTRVAASHIRVGTFEFAARFHGKAAVQSLADYAIHRHFPEVKLSPEPYREFLAQVMERQAQLLARWMGVGFIHGVMNTDNMLISGETIDYGPCAFMDRYDPETVFSSIDHQGRYALGNQPRIAHWNLTRLAETLLPLLNENEQEAILIAQGCLEGFSHTFSAHWLNVMHDKLGILDAEKSLIEDPSLIDDLLNLMEKYGLDFTLTFRALTRGEAPSPSDPAMGPEFETAWTAWKARWELRRGNDPETLQKAQLRMRQSNPDLIPRNHQVEAALSAFSDGQNPEPFQKLLQALSRPYEDLPEHQAYLEPAPEGAEPYQTFCGT